jgi:hypothetical protein
VGSAIVRLEVSKTEVLMLLAVPMAFTGTYTTPGSTRTLLMPLKAMPSSNMGKTPERLRALMPEGPRSEAIISAARIGSKLLASLRVRISIRYSFNMRYATGSPPLRPERI